jgi:hypothetical protein
MNVVVYTTTHRIIGQVIPGAPGLFSYLNRPTESYVEIEDGEMNPLHQITKQGESVDQLWLVKDEIAAVVVESRTGLGPSSAARAGYTKPFPHWVHILVGGYELRGLIESGARFDFAALMFEGDSKFVPMYNAKLTAILFPRVQADAPAMVFNRAMVHALNLIPREEIP